MTTMLHDLPVGPWMRNTIYRQPLFNLLGRGEGRGVLSTDEARQTTAKEIKENEAREINSETKLNNASSE